MDGRNFLDVAREQVQGTTSAHWRAAAGRAYYAILLEGREALRRWGFVPGPRENVHPFVRLRFRYAADADMKSIGTALEVTSRLRNLADYDLNAPQFSRSSYAQQSITNAANALVLLDAIVADPARVAAVTADLRARWP
jgi:hypothetical protein